MLKKSKYYIVTVDKDGRVLRGESVGSHDFLVDMLMFVGLKCYDRQEKEVFICEVIVDDTSKLRNSVANRDI